MITTAIWCAWFAAFCMFKIDDRWKPSERRFLLVLYTAAPILATIAVNA